jgi:prepilin-type N-terminal cleavage/methylation domain-containing protein
MKTALRGPRAVRGFTLIEVLVVVGILGIFMVVSYPSIMNTLAVRDLDNATREIQTFLQQTKLQAVNTRIAHRVRFFQIEGTTWAYEMERIGADGTWARAQRAPTKTISRRFNVTVTFPPDSVTGDPVAAFSALGMFSDFTTTQNSITLQYPKLARPDVDDERVLSVFMGGSIHYSKEKST